MSKKNFSGGLDSLLGDSKKKPGRPKTSTRKVEKTSQEGTKEKETRATFIVNEDSLEKLKAIAYWDRKLIKEVVDEAIQDYIDKHEKKSGKVKPIPEDK